MPADYNPSAEMQAELEADYPELDFKLEMRGLRANPFEKSQTDWDYTTRLWFYRSASWRPKPPTAPGKENGGDWRRDTTTTNKRTQETERQFQAALADYDTYRAKQTAMDVNYEDITHDRARLPGIYHPA